MSRWCACAAALLLVLSQGTAQAGIFTHVDPVSGMTVMSNVARSSPAAAVKTVAAPRAAGAAAADFPRVSKERQSELDGGRRSILDNELAAEQQALAAAAARRAEQSVLHRHQANVAALQRELQAMR